MSDRIFQLSYKVTPEVRQVIDHLMMEGETNNCFLERMVFDYIRLFPQGSTGMEVTAALELRDEEIRKLKEKNSKLTSIIQDLDKKANVRTVVVTRSGKLVKRL